MNNARVLIDNCVPFRFKAQVHAASVVHVSELGWDKLQDGFLLRRADEVFDVIITTDRSIPEQQNLNRYNLAILILRAPSNSLPRLLPLVAEVNRAIESVRDGEVVKLFAPNFFPRDFNR